MIQQFGFWVNTHRTESRVSKRYLYSHVHSSIIHKSQKVEPTQVSSDKWMDKLNVVHTYNEILLRLMQQHGWTLKILCSVK